MGNTRNMHGIDGKCIQSYGLKTQKEEAVLKALAQMRG
jgi:hypothetical protein